MPCLNRPASSGTTGRVSLAVLVEDLLGLGKGFGVIEPRERQYAVGRIQSLRLNELGLI